MAASIPASTIRERLGQQFEDLLRNGHYEELDALLKNQLMSRPDDRELHLYQLLLATKAEGVATHEREIERLRNLTDLSDREREVIRQIFILGFDEAQREGTKEKAWVYQRLARRLILRQSLLESLPSLERSEARDPEHNEQSVGGLLEFSGTLSAGRNAHAAGYKGKQKLLGSVLLSVAGLGLGAFLLQYVPVPRNQSRLELPAANHVQPAGGTGVSEIQGESAPVTRNVFASHSSVPLDEDTPPIAAAGSVEHQVVPTTKVAPKPAPVGRIQAEGSPTNKGKKKEQNISTVTVASAGVKAANVSPVSVLRQGHAKEGLADRARDEAQERELGTYRIRVDIGLRREPRFGSPRGATIKKGTLISALDLDRSWLRVRVLSDGTTGFIRKEFLVPVSSTEPR